MNEKYKYRKSDVEIGYLMSNRAITLISLVITIIILIILAGVGINLALGENGIFNKAKYAKEQYVEKSAKEKLETALMEALIEKETNKDYNSTDFLDELLESNGIQVSDDNVIVDNYIFIIDREKLEILENLGETKIKITAKVQKYLGKNENEKYEASILLTIESNSRLENIAIQNKNGTIFEMQTEKENLEKDLVVEFDEEYTVTVSNKAGKTQKYKIIERTQEKIRTVEELVEFRNKVNTGLSYEGKIVNLVNDIDLSSVCGENINGEKINWEPIGVGGEICFKGTFDGNNKKISNIYINANKNNQGLFGVLNSATIKNIIIDSSNIQGTNRVGSIAGSSGASTIENIHTTSNCTITTTSDTPGGYVGGIVGSTGMGATINKCSNFATVSSNNGNFAGGIAGIFRGTMNECYNAGNINTNQNDSAGGIIGVNYYDTEVNNCYNKGNIKGHGGIGGIAGCAHGDAPFLTINNCYNMGTVTGNAYVGEVIGNIAASDGKTNNCYTKSQALTATSSLGDAYIEDGKKIDKDGNIVENKDNKGNVIYINDKYPILKWQVKEN